MTPKEKAIQIIDSFTQINGNSLFAKECAFMVVDEMLKECTALNPDLVNPFYKSEKVVYWASVRVEIDHIQ